MNRLTIRLGPLSKPLEARCKTIGKSPVEYVRGLIAADCGVEAPELSAGNPSLTPATARKMQKKAVKSRLKKKSENNP